MRTSKKAATAARGSSRGQQADTTVIAKNLSRIRRERGVTQVELAQSLGMSQSRLSKYERGRLRLHGELIAQLSRILAVSADEILGLVPSQRDSFQVRRRFLRRLQHIDKLSTRDQSALLRTIDGFVSGRLQRPA